MTPRKKDVPRDLAAAIFINLNKEMATCLFRHINIEWGLLQSLSPPSLMIAQIEVPCPNNFTHDNLIEIGECFKLRIVLIIQATIQRQFYLAIVFLEMVSRKNAWSVNFVNQLAPHIYQCNILRHYQSTRSKSR